LEKLGLYKKLTPDRTNLSRRDALQRSVAAIG